MPFPLIRHDIYCICKHTYWCDCLAPFWTRRWRRNQMHPLVALFEYKLREIGGSTSAYTSISKGIRSVDQLVGLLVQIQAPG